MLPDLEGNSKADVEEMIKHLEDWDGSFAEDSVPATIYSYW